MDEFAEQSEEAHHSVLGPPPKMVQEEEDRPEDSIPDLPENKAAREFLKKAPTKGLWMPLGKEVKVMQCWRCKGYGHRTGDRECPYYLVGNPELEKERLDRMDPMRQYLLEQNVHIEETKPLKKQLKIKDLQEILKEAKKKEKEKKKKKKRKRHRDEKEKHSHHRHHHSKKHSKHKKHKKEI